MNIDLEKSIRWSDKTTEIVHPYLTKSIADTLHLGLLYLKDRRR
jgi:hypothetical protein